MPDVSYLAAFGAGIFSFISPCVLPLVPGYISFISGVSFDEMQSADGGRAARTRRQMLITSLAFVLGLALVFIAFGASATVARQTLRRYKSVLEKIGGVLLVIFGLHLAGVFRIRFLDQDTRIQTLEAARPARSARCSSGWPSRSAGRRASARSSAASWRLPARANRSARASACSRSIRPASASRFCSRRSPIDKFFIASNASASTTRRSRSVAGGLLIFLGVLIFTGQFTQITRYIDKMFPWLTNLS